MKYIAVTETYGKAGWEIVEGEDVADAGKNFEETLDYNVSSYVLLPYNEVVAMACEIVEYNGFGVVRIKKED